MCDCKNVSGWRLALRVVGQLSKSQLMRAPQHRESEPMIDCQQLGTYFGNNKTSLKKKRQGVNRRKATKAKCGMNQNIKDRNS